jgi:hypothetical protein
MKATDGMKFIIVRFQVLTAASMMSTIILHGSTSHNTVLNKMYYCFMQYIDKRVHCQKNLTFFAYEFIVFIFVLIV